MTGRERGNYRTDEDNKRDGETQTTSKSQSAGHQSRNRGEKLGEILPGEGGKERREGVKEPLAQSGRNHVGYVSLSPSVSERPFSVPFVNNSR